MAVNAVDAAAIVVVVLGIVGLAFPHLIVRNMVWRHMSHLSYDEFSKGRWGRAYAGSFRLVGGLWILFGVALLLF